MGINVWLGLAVVLLLVLATGFFVAGEFAFVAVNRSRVEARAREGDRKSQRLAGRLKELSFELSGAQLGITVTSLIIGVLAEDTVARFIGPVLERIGITSHRVALGVALVLATSFTMVLGELIPKNIAIARPYPVAIRVGLAMATFNRLLRPLIVFLNAAANWTVRRFGIEPHDELVGLRSLQELELIVLASSAEGHIDPQRTSLLTRAIGFIDRDAAEVMVARVDVVGIPSTSTIADLRELSRDSGHSRFPVFGADLDDIVGIAHVKDTFGIAPADRARTAVTEITAPAHVVPESIHLDSLLLELQRAGRSIAVVADEYGGTAGIVTTEDIVEEILGEIEDEYDSPGAAGSDGVFDGGLHRHEIAEQVGFEWPDGNYETLSGFITDRLERFPVVGDTIELAGYRLEVLEVGNGVAERVRISALDTSP